MTVEPKVAVFIDFENLALGAKDTPQGTFDIQLVLKRLLEKGRLVYKRAYADWSHYRQYTRPFHENGIELIDIPQSKISGKNSADIRMVVDALDLCYAKQHIDVFGLVSGDSDFSPLVSKLKENNKRVVGCGIKSSTSDLLIGNCDEFIYYDDLARAAGKKKSKSRARPPSKNSKKDEAMDMLIEIIDSLEEDYDPLWGSLVKQSMRRIHPGFSESYYGFKTFSELLQEAEKRNLIALAYDQSRGNYTVQSK